LGDQGPEFLDCLSNPIRRNFWLLAFPFCFAFGFLWRHFSVGAAGCCPERSAKSEGFYFLF
jgi:hypothetical protein